MEYISKERLMQLEYELRPKHSMIADHNLLISREILLSECKELPQEQWQTIEEFKANPVEGWCWISMQDNKLKHLHYRNDGFWISDNKDIVFHNHYFITHVMPIKTPEAPK